MAWGSTLTPQAEIMPPSIGNATHVPSAGAFSLANELVVPQLNNPNPVGAKSSSYKRLKDNAIEAL